MSFTPMSLCLLLTQDFKSVSTGAELMAISAGSNIREDPGVFIKQVTGPLQKGE